MGKMLSYNEMGMKIICLQEEIFQLEKENQEKQIRLNKIADDLSELSVILLKARTLLG